VADALDSLAALIAIGDLHRPRRGKCAECRKAFPCPTFGIIEITAQEVRRSGLVIPPGAEIKYVERRSDWILEPRDQDTP
jgi:hypothetical protein